MNPPLDQRLGFIGQQLNPSEFRTNMFYLRKNKYELDDSHYPFNPFTKSEEGEFFAVD